jgi:hypothetical protein
LEVLWINVKCFLPLWSVFWHPSLMEWARTLPINLKTRDVIIRFAQQSAAADLPYVIEECRKHQFPQEALHEYKAFLSLYLECKFLAFICQGQLSSRDKEYFTTPSRTYNEQHTKRQKASRLANQLDRHQRHQIKYCVITYLNSIGPQLENAAILLGNPDAQVSLDPQFSPNAIPCNQRSRYDAHSSNRGIKRSRSDTSLK